MGHFHHRLENFGDEHMIAKTIIRLWMEEFMKEAEYTREKDLKYLLDTWFTP